jgi:hypothetical protein
VPISQQTDRFVIFNDTDMNTRNTFGTVILVMLLICSKSLFTQYADYRNRKVDSLEQVLATNPPTGNELATVYRNLGGICKPTGKNQWTMPANVLQ